MADVDETNPLGTDELTHEACQLKVVAAYQAIAALNAEGRSRELSMVFTKLDEATMWLERDRLVKQYTTEVDN